MQGGTAVTMRHFDPLRFLEVMAEERITHAFVVPSMAVQLLQLDWRDYDLSSLQVWFSASAPLPSAIRDEVRRRLPGVTMINGLGTTEAGPVANLSTPELDAKPGNCVGKPWMGIAVTVLTDGGEPTPPGHVGNLAVQSAGVMDGYLDNPEATAEVFQHGWYLTGDLARLDDEGYLYLVDRKRDMIISGGENIYAAEVEDVLYSMQSVAEAAVVAQPHPVWGEVPIAFIVPKVGMTVTQDDVRQYCGRRLAGYKIPKATYIVDSLPRNTFGKVLKTVLRERLAAKLGDR
jgi:acyl-CoA synthetase (AMP-forming)/AMP-acid ligase II